MRRNVDPVGLGVDDQSLMTVPGGPVVATTVPPAPTAQRWLVSTKDTPLRASVVPEIWAVQVAPPSVVATIVPPAPTAQPWLVSTKDTLLRPSVVFEV